MIIVINYYYYKSMLLPSPLFNNRHHATFRQRRFHPREMVETRPSTWRITMQGLPVGNGRAKSMDN